MTIKVVLGLPYLSSGALTQTARSLQAPVLLSANSFARWKDEFPVPSGLSKTDAAQQRLRTWAGWNLNQLKHAHNIKELWLDSAGFVAQMAYGGFPWTPQDYIFGLCAQFPFTRFASLDCCVEPEIARDRDEVRERISKTVALNRECRRWSTEAGIEDRLMHVIQGANASDYIACFDRMHAMIGDKALIGVGSMCRRQTHGPDGVIAIVEALDRHLPEGVKIHLFGVKGAAAASVGMLSRRIYSIDSQAYGIHARQRAIKERAINPQFSKTNEFVAGIMSNWWTNQIELMEASKDRSLQSSFAISEPSDPKPETVFDALLMRTRAEFNQLVEDGELDHDEIISGSWILQAVQERIGELPANVHPHHPFMGLWQMPEEVQDNWPVYVCDTMLHPELRANPAMRMALAA